MKRAKFTEEQIIEILKAYEHNLSDRGLSHILLLMT
jgi:hypothetical protein